MNFASLAFTKENLEEPSPIESGGQAACTDEGANQTSAAEVITAEADMTEEANGIDKINTGFDAADDAVNTLSEVQGELSDNEENHPGLSSLEEAAVQATHESIMSALGISRVMPSMESVPYTGKREALIATLEDAKKGIVERIVDGLKVLGRGILNFIQGLFRNTWVLTKYLNYVKKKAAQVSGEASQATMTKSAAAMSVSGTSGMSSVHVMADTANAFMALSMTMVDRMNRLNFKFDANEDDTKFKESDFVTHATVPIRNNEDSVGYLTGDRAVGIGKFNFMGISSTHQQSGSHVPNTAGEVSVATKSQMATLLKEAETIIAAIKKFDSKHSMIKNIISGVLNFGASVLLVYPSLLSKDADKARNTQLRLVTMRSMISASMSRLPLEAFKIAKAFIDYANHSTKYYVGKDGKSLDSNGDNIPDFEVVPDSERLTRLS